MEPATSKTLSLTGGAAGNSSVTVEAFRSMRSFIKSIFVVSTVAAITVHCTPEQARAWGEALIAAADAAEV